MSFKMFQNIKFKLNLFTMIEIEVMTIYQRSDNLIHVIKVRLTENKIALKHNNINNIS